MGEIEKVSNIKIKLADPMIFTDIKIICTKTSAIENAIAFHTKH